MSLYAIKNARTVQPTVRAQFHWTRARCATESYPFDNRLCRGIIMANVTAHTAMRRAKASTARSRLHVPHAGGGLNAVRTDSTSSTNMTGATIAPVERVWSLCC